MRPAECGKKWRATGIRIPEKQWLLEASPCNGEIQGLVTAVVGLPKLPRNRFRVTDPLTLPVESLLWLPHLPVGRLPR